MRLKDRVKELESDVHNLNKKIVAMGQKQKTASAKGNSKYKVGDKIGDKIVYDIIVYINYALIDKDGREEVLSEERVDEMVQKTKFIEAHKSFFMITAHKDRK